MIWLLFLASTAFADENLSAIRNLEAELPDYSVQRISEEDEIKNRQNRRFKPTYHITKMPEIETSGTEFGYVPAGANLVKIEDNKVYSVPRGMNVRYFRLQDEQGYKYLLNKDESCTYKILGENVSAIKHELALYEPPTRYSPVPKQIIKKEFDENISVSPQLNYYLGMVQGDYMRDLFNDPKAYHGITNQFGAQFMGKFNLFVNPGLALHYEKTSYQLSQGGSIDYTSPSFGPRLTSKNFNLDEYLVRFNAEIRMSPWAKAAAQTSNGNVTYQFNSTDLFLSAEHQIKNSLGEFVLGVFFQDQWLNLKNQTEIVKLNSSNNSNKSIGLSLGQVF